MALSASNEPFLPSLLLHFLDSVNSLTASSRCHFRVTETHSHLIDGPLDYSPSSKCTWVIESEKVALSYKSFSVLSEVFCSLNLFQKAGAPLTIRLESFQTECGWDFVYIYDGDGVYGEQLAAFW